MSDYQSSREVAAMILTVLSGLLAFISVLVYIVAVAGASENQALYLVNTFGFFVGLSAIAMALYVQFGPRMNLLYTPSHRFPPRVPILLFVLGSSVILTSLRFVTHEDSTTYFWRVVGLAILLALATGFTVSSVLRYAPSDEAPLKK